MFPETEQQAVSEMMATESNYPPLKYWVHGDGVLAFFLSRSVGLTPYNITSDPSSLLSFFATEKRSLHGQKPVDNRFSVSLVSFDEGSDSKDQFRQL